MLLVCKFSGLDSRSVHSLLCRVEASGMSPAHIHVSIVILVSSCLGSHCGETLWVFLFVSFLPERGQFSFS